MLVRIEKDREAIRLPTLFSLYTGGTTNLIEGDILHIGSGVICHQVNLRRVAGAGLALQIRKRWPEWYRHYRSVSGYLGLVDFFRADRDLWIASLYAQEGYGTGRQTNYAAFGQCLMDLRRTHHGPVYLPYGIGCGLGGGDWRVIEQIIGDALPDANIVVLPR